MSQYKWMKLIIVCLTVVLPVCFMMSCKNSDITINEQQKDSEITGFDAEFKLPEEFEKAYFKNGKDVNKIAYLNYGWLDSIFEF